MAVRTRKRSKSRPDESDHKVLNCTVGGPWSQTDLTMPAEEYHYHEIIHDLVDYDYFFKPVSHSKAVIVPGTPEPIVKDQLFGPSLMTMWHGRYVPVEWTTPEGTCDPLGGHDLFSADGFLSESDAQEFYHRTVMNVFDVMPEEVSLANFIFELSDAEGLLRNLNSYSWSNHVLNFNFGWIPIIADLKAFINLSRDVQRRLEALRKINRRWVTLTHAQTFSYGPVGTRNIGGTSPFYQPAPTGIQKVSSIVEARARVACYYNMDLYGVDAALKACLAYLGLDNWAKIGWNAIPFSFVVDWLTGISDLLTRCQNQNELTFTGSLTIGATNCSFKMVEQYEGYSCTKEPVFPFPREYSTYCSAMVNSYHRRYGLPNAAPVVDGLTPKQQLLAAALLDTNLGAWGGHLPSRLVARKAR